jgi:hypothetical protein
MHMVCMAFRRASITLPLVPLVWGGELFESKTQVGFHKALSVAVLLHSQVITRRGKAAELKLVVTY